MTSFVTTICTLENMTPDHTRVLDRRYKEWTPIVDYVEKPKRQIGRRVHIWGEGVDIVLDDMIAASKWFEIDVAWLRRGACSGEPRRHKEDGKYYKLQYIEHSDDLQLTDNGK